MGATIFTRQAVEVIETPSGLGFLLYEETYENNCYPHTPHWGCVGAGRRDQVLQTIFRFSGGCEGGIFRPRSGRITPEAYVGRWKKAFSHALQVQEQDIRVDRKMAPMSWHKDDTPNPPIAGVADCPLDPDRSAAWDAGEMITLQLAADFDAIAWLIKGGHLSPWRAIGCHPALGNPQQDASEQIFLPRQKGSSVAFEIPQFFRLFKGEEAVFKSSVTSDGVIELEALGWDYSAVGSYAAHYDEVEKIDPGWYAQRIKAYRESVKAATILSPDTVLHPVARPGMEKYAQDRVNVVAAQYPSGVLLRDVIDSSDRYRLGQVNRWRVATLQPQLPQLMAA